MPGSDLGDDITKLRDTASGIADTVLAPLAATVDRDACWPSESMAALANAGLMGLHIPRRCGGHEQGLLALSVITGRTWSRLQFVCDVLCHAQHCSEGAGGKGHARPGSALFASHC